MSWIPSCGEMTRAVSEARDSGRRLGPREWLHLAICAGCRRFREQVRRLGEAAARLSGAAGALSEDAKRRLRDSLRGG